MRRSRAPLNQPGAFFAARSWAGCTTNMFGFDLRQAQVVKSLKLTVTGPGPPINLRSTTAVRCPDLAMCQARYSAERGFQGKTRAHMRGGYLEATPCSKR